MKPCSHCHQLVPENQIYCPNCGTPNNAYRVRKRITSSEWADSLLGFFSIVVAMLLMALPSQSTMTGINPAGGFLMAMVFCSLPAMLLGMVASAIAHWGMRYSALARGMTLAWGLLLLGWMGAFAVCVAALVGMNHR